MIPLVISILAIIIMIIYFIKNYFDEEILFMVLVLCIINILIMVIVGISHRTEVWERHNLATLQLHERSGLSGSAVFILGVGGGSVSSYETTKYQYFAESDSGFKLMESDTHSSYIKTDIKEEQPYVEVKVTRSNCKKEVNIFPLSLWGINCISFTEGAESERIFHIPEGSFKNDYEIDLGD